MHAHGLLEFLCAVIRVFATLGEHGLGQPVKLGLDRVLRSPLRVLEQRQSSDVSAAMASASTWCTVSLAASK